MVLLPTREALSAKRKLIPTKTWTTVSDDSCPGSNLFDARYITDIDRPTEKRVCD